MVPVPKQNRLSVDKLRYYVLDPQFNNSVRNQVLSFPIVVASYPEQIEIKPLPKPRYCGSLTIWQRRRVTQYIEENLSNIIRIEDLADLVRLSPGYFTTTFKTAFGISPYQYIISQRLDMAKYLLQNTNLPLCEIAIDCGLSDQSHLCNLFRRTFGMSPSKWRKRQDGLSSSVSAPTNTSELAIR
ncbi:helix-turn-helix domain-containing protein [Aliirhizobium cellulosilyticum]|uniref:AraC-like DNA-binding protein n=1 Tax=Aliirhizobium cellulosilyticum TaxID=393664 RepID=A0A7W6Y2I6_9HYPH|nr:AraC-like DNA-binding protein [Rhizobium cellulosilyticum]MBB4412360.1 AraC-like DNA-binding protein [Rhizobium cellulosilyticum]MBB4446992.1 AraC-like DNA-binding protein [Rhizobium cellulosilyticum]